jgi:hypothetical protein
MDATLLLGSLLILGSIAIVSLDLALFRPRVSAG